MRKTKFGYRNFRFMLFTDEDEDGVGDQPVEDNLVAEETTSFETEDYLVELDKTKVVEKKKRATDLVMNSKKILTEYLLSDESRKKQEEWEVTNEKVLQVIELDQNETINDTKNAHETEEVEEFTPIPVDECMEVIELDPKKAEKEDENREGRGDDVKNKSGSSHLQNEDLACDLGNHKQRGKFETFIKKKWNFSLNFFRISKKKQTQEKDEKTTCNCLYCK